MRTLFTEGLKDKVQLQDCPEDLDELFQMVINIDGRLYMMQKRLEESLGCKKDPSSSPNNSNRNPPTHSISSTPYIPSPK